MNPQKVNELLDAMAQSIKDLRSEIFFLPATTEINISVGDNINDAIDSLWQTGGIITVEPGNYPINIDLEERSALFDVITIRSSAYIPTRRVEKADVVNMPVFFSENTEPTIKAHNKSGGFLFQNIAFGAIMFDRTMVELGGDSNEMKNRFDRPRNFTFDGCLWLGSPLSGQHRGITVNAYGVTIVNSAFYDIFEMGRDSQAICGWNGTEAVFIDNCYIEAGAENVMFGGSTSASAEMIPRNVTVTGCYITKKRSWLEVPNGVSINIKAVFELKNVIGFHMNGCILENCWAKNWSSGVGMTLKSCNQENEPWATMKDVLVENCVIRNVGSPFNVVGQNDSGRPSVRAKNVVIRNVLAYNINKAPYTGDARGILVSNTPENWTVENCTILGAANSIMSISIDNGIPQATEFIYRNNVQWHGEYGVFTSFGLGIDALNYAFNQDYLFANNIFRRNPVRQNRFPISNIQQDPADFDKNINLATFEYGTSGIFGINYAKLTGALKDKI